MASPLKCIGLTQLPLSFCGELDSRNYTGNYIVGQFYNQ